MKNAPQLMRNAPQLMKNAPQLMRNAPQLMKNAPQLMRTNRFSIQNVCAPCQCVWKEIDLYWLLNLSLSFLSKWCLCTIPSGCLLFASSRPNCAWDHHEHVRKALQVRVRVCVCKWGREEKKTGEKERERKRTYKRVVRNRQHTRAHGI